MLLLTRKIGEAIIIGDDIKIIINDVRRSQVNVAIEAPREISVHREEIYNRIKANQFKIKEQSENEI